MTTILCTFPYFPFSYSSFSLVKYHVIIHYLFAPFSVARVPHDDEAKLSRERRGSVTGGQNGTGDGGGNDRRETAVDEKAGRRQQTG